MTEDDLIETFSTRLRATRVAKGLTQEQLGELVGASGMQISHIELRRRLPRLPACLALADALGVSIDYLVGRRDEP